MPSRQQTAVLSAAAIPIAYLAYVWRSSLSDTLLGSKSRPSTPLNTPRLDSYSREAYVEHDGVRDLLIPDYSRGKLSKLSIRPTKASTFALHRQFFKQPRTGKVAINAEFFKQLRNIMRICIPRATSNEVFLFTLHSLFLLLRTYLSLLGAQLDGRIVKNLVQADAKGFAQGLLYWYLLALPSSYTNSMIRYVRSRRWKLSLY
jgi:ATP-binding cassette subfamily D (ALD) long-chain fatty acid import protein